MPGIGGLLIGAMTARDYAVVQGTMLALGLLFVAGNAFADVSYVFLDPRTRRA